MIKRVLLLAALAVLLAKPLFAAIENLPLPVPAPLPSVEPKREARSSRTLGGHHYLRTSLITFPFSGPYASLRLEGAYATINEASASQPRGRPGPCCEYWYAPAASSDWRRWQDG